MAKVQLAKNLELLIIAKELPKEKPTLEMPFKVKRNSKNAITRFTLTVFRRDHNYTGYFLTKQLTTKLTMLNQKSYR